MLAHIDAESRKKLIYLMTYNGEEIIEEAAFLKIMKAWSTFTANDINNDNRLDVMEIKIMWWIHDNKKPSLSKVDSEIAAMDTDRNGVIDRLEWLAYLCSPAKSGQRTLGNKDYFDFKLRDYFEEVDSDKDGLLNVTELENFMKLDWGEFWNKLDDEGK